nr:phage head closure protein [uncultured Bacteroides sp.]
MDKFTTRAQVTTNSGNRQNQNNEIIHTYNVTFIVRLYHDIEESDRVIYNGKKYRIISINKELYKQSINIIGELINE